MFTARHEAFDTVDYRRAFSSKETVLNSMKTKQKIGEKHNSKKT